MGLVQDEHGWNESIDVEFFCFDKGRLIKQQKTAKDA
jgi:hypothetical protein